MCELTTEWILESAQSFSVCTYIYILVTFYGSGAENYSFLGVRGNSDAQKGAVTVQKARDPIASEKQIVFI